jgi:hypothetical protein
VCTGDPRNCFDEDPCTIDTCNRRVGHSCVCTRTCTFVSGSSCPAQCQPIFCGNGRIDPGETCDPPDATPQPGRRGSDVPARLHVMRGRAHAAGRRGDVRRRESDDGVQSVAPDAAAGRVPDELHAPICQDPARIRYVNGWDPRRARADRAGGRRR